MSAEYITTIEDDKRKDSIPFICHTYKKVTRWKNKPDKKYIRIYYYDDSLLAEYYTIGKKTLSLHYDTHGDIWKKETKYKGELHGPYERYHSCDQLCERGVFKKGLQEGLWEKWFSNGKPKSIGTYHLGYLEGFWIYWDRHGAITWRGAFHKDNPVGVCYAYGEQIIY